MSLQFDNVYASTNCTANLLLGQYASLLIQYIDTTINLTLSQLLDAYYAQCAVPVSLICGRLFGIFLYETVQLCEPVLCTLLISIPPTT